MNLSKLIDLCDAYARLGGVVQDQLGALLDGDDLEDQNVNALVLINDFLAMTHDARVTDSDEVGDRVAAYVEGWRDAFAAV